MTRSHEVFVVVRRGGEFLVLHRSEVQGGYWHSVAGGVEAGESAADAARRELREETGLDAEPEPTGHTFVYEPEPWERHAGSVAIRVDCFVAHAPAAWEPELDWEHDDFRWCAVDDAVALLYWPEPRVVLRALASPSEPRPPRPCPSL